MLQAAKLEPSRSNALARYVSDLDRKRYSERPAQISNFRMPQFADKIGQNGFREAHELVTVDGAVVLLPFVDSDRHLRRQGVVT